MRRRLSLLRPAGTVALVALLAGAEAPSLQAQSAPLSPRNASYDIDVTLDPALRTISGSEVITWRNTGQIPAYSLRMHLYWNAFRSTQSTWMRQRSLGGRSPFADRDADDFGWIEVGTLQRLGEGQEVVQDLKPGFRYIQPYDGNPDDTSLAVVPLTEPIPPGATLRLRVTWTGKFPRNFDRTGQIGNYFFVSQWFPKLGVFEGNVWTAAQFFANTEFFSDFGRYDVRMTVPSGWTVGATGVEQSRTDDGGGRTTHRYVQDDVHDFAWTTSPDFVERRQTFEQPGLPRVQMRLLLQPEHAGQEDRYFAATAATLRYYGEWFGPYPYPQLTIVDPAWQSSSDGMEYPTLFTAGSRWLAPRGSNLPEYVTIHEAGHQFWYGIVATNEVEHAWMDEGLNEFSDSRVQSIAFQPNYLVQRFFGGFLPWQFRDIPLKRATDTNWMNAYRRYADRDAPANPTYLFYPESNQAQTYHKTALWLHTLERRLGWEVLQKVLATYFDRWKFKHPAPEDFMAIVNEVTGQDYTWFFDAVYRSSNKFDYAIESITSEPVATKHFVDTPAGTPTFEATSVDGVFHSVVVARRLEAGQYPVDVVITFANGEQVREHWDGLARWQPFAYDRPSKAVSAEVDPERQLLLDTNFTNNSKTVEPQGPAAARKWTLHWVVWLQDLLLTYGFLV